MLSERIKNSKESVTLKLNAQANELKKAGNQIYNLSAGQLPFPPDPKLLKALERQLPQLSSFQYSPVPGFPALRQKVLHYIERTRAIALPSPEFDCIVSTGAKQSLFNLLATLVNPRDELLILSPYWVSYPEMIKYWQGTPVVVPASNRPGEPPPIACIEKAITPKTKGILINTPGNPSGVYYGAQWVEDFAQLMTNHPQVAIISDEIYSQLHYSGPGPRYPYQLCPELLARTFIIDGISKSMACTGLRIGFTIGVQPVIKAMAKIQGQSTSGASSLVQKALMEYDFCTIKNYLAPIKEHLLTNSLIVQEKLQQYGLARAWYPTNGAFYFFLHLDELPALTAWHSTHGPRSDGCEKICAQLLAETGVVVVPGNDFGRANALRLSLVLEKSQFTQAIERMCKFIAQV